VIRTFLDAGVLIAAFRSRNATSTPALTLLDDPERVFVTTDYVRLEVLPKPLYFRRQTEAEFYEAFFAALLVRICIVESITFPIIHNSSPRFCRRRCAPDHCPYDPRGGDHAPPTASEPCARPTSHCSRPCSPPSVRPSLRMG
jgi:hypothetical protein